MAPSRSRSKSQSRRAPLEEDILNTGHLRTKPKKRKATTQQEDAGYVDSRSSRKILKIGQDLMEEEEQENKSKVPNPAFTFESRYSAEEGLETEDLRYDDEESWGDEEDEAIEEVVCISVCL